MTILCLSVVLCALFITVFNSRTANRISSTEATLKSNFSARSGQAKMKNG